MKELNPQDLIEKASELFPDVGINSFSKLLPYFKIQKLKKNDIYIDFNEKSYKIALVWEGLLRTIYVKNGEEITAGFFSENSLVASYRFLVFQEPGNYQIKSCEDCVLLETDNRELFNMYQMDPNLAMWGRKLINREFAHTLDRLESHILDSPEERYEKLLKENKSIFNRVPQKQIASYLGITPVSLSRIRARKLNR
ncbi:MAG: Crp/Fnr family transcriptional regulator [Flavobacteriales bacterium]|nr:Crp/Fnr family transcriptional regulator [Flavobacteriales bacterium]